MPHDKMLEYILHQAVTQTPALNIRVNREASKMRIKPIKRAHLVAGDLAIQFDNGFMSFAGRRAVGRPG